MDMETLKAISTRKSVRSYQSRQISAKDLDTVLFAGSIAPVAMGARETLHFSVVQNKDLLSKIGSTAASISGRPGYDPFYNAPTLIVISGKIQSPGNLESINVACAAENIVLAATDLGLGSTYLTGFLPVFKSNPEFLEEVGIPARFTPLSAVILGFPTDSQTSEKEFKLPEAINYVR
jgi:nitroreductase